MEINCGRIKEPSEMNISTTQANARRCARLNIFHLLSMQRSRLSPFHPFTLLTACCLLAFACAQSALGATLTTDKPDYVPGEHVTFTGTGWQPGEIVTIEIYETSVDPFFDEGGVTAVADAYGNISNSDFQCQ